MNAPRKQRLDELLVDRGLADSRAQAKALIMSGRVRQGTARLDKPGKVYPSDLDVFVDQPPRFVSRGGEKLQGFLDQFQISLTDRHILDVGASTGGFTDCALQAGAATAVCVDVGRAQLHAKLRDDPRLAQTSLPRDAFDAIVMDLSFISLRKVLPAVWTKLTPHGILIALVKPQFEAGKAEVDKGRGVIRDAAVQAQVLADIQAFALACLPGAQLIGTMDSPIVGTDGNREFLLGLNRA
jgi:23S rRNA (cytidine1920-2'-O)/16S rRNA (cytidine1409-2'-O)-methyltransferase